MRSTRITVYAALAANLAVAAAKAVAGLVTGSSAMLAEAAHSLADCANQGLLRVSLSLAEREPDREHPFGHGHERYFWALLAAIFVFLAGAVFSCARGAYGLVAGRGGEGSFLVNYVVLAVAVVAEGASLGRATQQMLGASRDARKPLRQYIRESRDPTTKTVLLEDLAGVAGILLAFAGVGLHQLTGASRFDAAASVLIGLLLGWVAVTIGRDARHLLLGAAARPEELRAIEEAIRSHPAVDELVELRTMALHPAALLVAARVSFDGALGGDELEEVSGEIDDALQRAVPEVSEVFLDPTPAAGATPRSRRTARR